MTNVADYDHNRMVNIGAEGDRSTSLSIGVYQGNASLVVFANKANVARFSLNRQRLVQIKEELISLITAAPGTKTHVPFTKWDIDSKKSIPIGNLFIGKDDKSVIYFGVQTPGHPPIKFSIKVGLGIDGAEPYTDAQKSVLAVKTIIDQFTTDIPYAMTLTSVKKNNVGGSGGAATTRPSTEEFF